MQLEQVEKGFSFSKEGPLDMRMDPASGLTAEQIVNQWPEQKLGEIFLEFGEEKRWRRAAKAIVDYRRKQAIKTTKQLSDLICDTLGRGSKKKLHPATLIFQALRICVNEELSAIEEGISKAIEFLGPGGRIGAISFHRLEDRIVKNLFRSAAGRGVEKGQKMVEVLTKKPIVAGRKEISSNRRSRSAKMRFAEKVPTK